jgi:phosphonate transport system substrate-binding protein
MFVTLFRWILLGLALTSPARAGQVYTFAIVPQFAPVDIGIRWTPLLKRLEADTGLAFQLRIFEKTLAFEEDFLRGNSDFVYLNPYHMVMAAKTQGYTPLVRGAESLSGMLVVDRDGPIKTLADLNGANVAFPSPNAFGASLYMRALLSDKERLRFTPVYVGTHQNVYRHVLLGVEMAGGGVAATLDREPPTIRTRLHALYKTPETASHPVAVHPRVPREVRDRLARALIELNKDPGGRKLLDDVELSGAMAADYARDYLPLEKLKLDRYLVVDKK